MKKHLVEFIGVSEEKLPEIFLDMDQVMCNFLKGADKAVGGSFVQHPTPDRWKILEKTKDFWLNLEWMPGGNNYINFVLDIILVYYLHMQARIETLEWER